jgi:transketolase
MMLMQNQIHNAYPPEIQKLQELARKIRISILKMIHNAKSGHTGGSLSCTDILTCLYFHEMRHYPVQADWPGRDRFILSKGHAVPALYAVLKECGYLTQRDLDRLRKLNSILQGHPDSRRCPGIEASTGSLGQGLSIAHGMALALRDHPLKPRVYVVLGDGEMQEGQVWEAVMSAAHYKTSNLCAIVDANGLQIDGPVCRVKEVQPLREKFLAFGWHALEVDGHNIADLLQALQKARTHLEGPTVIVARTVKGKGVSIFENQVKWHGKAPNDKELELALKELGEPPQLPQAREAEGAKS